MCTEALKKRQAQAMWRLSSIHTRGCPTNSSFLLLYIINIVLSRGFYNVSKI